MPTYGYRCESCGAEFDVWQLMSSEPGAACPTCGSSSRRLFYPAGIVFKGSGFYKTDSRGSESSSTSSTSNGAATPSSEPAKKDSTSEPKSPGTSTPAPASSD